MICHITTPEIWRQAQDKGFVQNASLWNEGFIHCCLEHQVDGVIKRYYLHEPELVILYIEDSELDDPPRYELSPVINEFFPHVYGAIPVSAVKDQAIVYQLKSKL